MRQILLPPLAAAVLLGACATEPADPGERTAVDRGYAVAVTECSACHAIGPVGPSPRDGAPPLRSVLDSYNSATLEMDLMEGMRVGHADMPRFTFDPLTADVLIAYLQSIQQ